MNRIYQETVTNVIKPPKGKDSKPAAVCGKSHHKTHESHEIGFTTARAAIEVGNCPS